MTQVKSPYNFVPLNKKVFAPEWGKFVSQDIPFKDGLSGKIKLKIKAHTPIFVRGEGEEKEREVDGETINYTEYNFFKHNGKYCIPGTSIKGEIANVMEIMSFGRLHKINEHRYGVRDMSDRSRLVGQADKCGFLFRDGTGYKIEKCDDLIRIDYAEIKRATSENIGGLNVTEKYNKVGKNCMIPVFTDNDVMVVRGRRFPIVVAEYDPTSTLEGQLVVTNDFRGKENEFIFIPNGGKVQISNDIIDNFINAYFETDSDYKTLWENEFRNGNPIPVFYNTDGNGNILSIGFTQMFKLSYKNSIKDLIEKNYPQLLENKIDLVDSIFGYTDEDNNHKKLKGRVSIEPAMITDNSINEMNPVHTILGEPQPSFYPYYLFQNPDTNNNNRVNGRYKTYMDDEAVISGRKRYPVKEVTITYQPEDIDSPDVWVDFKPLPNDLAFETTIHYHNLRPVELGALLSAITFHNNNETYHHSIGMAKPLGYGNVTFSIDYSTSTIEEDESLNYMCIYEKMMEHFCQTECNNSHWLQTEQLIELFAMAEPLSPSHPNFENLTYLKLSDHQNIKLSNKRETRRECEERLGRRCYDNERQIINDVPKALPRYTDFVNRDISLKSLNCSFDFNPDEDKEQYYLTSPDMQSYIKSNKENIFQIIEQYLQYLKLIIQKKKEEKEKKRLQAIRDTEKVERKQFREEKGIKLLEGVRNMKSLMKQTNQWRIKYYDDHERKTITKAIIPEKYLSEFLNILNDLYEKNKEKYEWKNKKERTKNRKYLVFSIGNEKAEAWFKEKGLN